MLMPLSLLVKGMGSLAKSIAEFCSPELLDGKNGYYTPNDGQQVVLG